MDSGHSGLFCVRLLATLCCNQPFTSLSFLLACIDLSTSLCTCSVYFCIRRAREDIQEMFDGVVSGAVPSGHLSKISSSIHPPFCVSSAALLRLYHLDWVILGDA